MKPQLQLLRPWGIESRARRSVFVDDLSYRVPCLFDRGQEYFECLYSYIFASPNADDPLHPGPGCGCPTLLSIYSTKGRTEPPKGRTSMVQVTDISADHLLQVRVISPELRDALQAGLGVGRGVHGSGLGG